MSTRRVSVGLPLFNAEHFVDQVLDALLSQTYSDFELIISDNCSTDGTEEACRRFAARDSRIRYYRQESNIGVNRNHAEVFRLAHGEYFRWAAADDIPAHDLIEHAVSTLDDRPDVVAYVPNTVNIDANGELLKHSERTLNLEQDQPVDRVYALLTRGYQVTFGQGMLRRDLVAKTSRRWTHFGWDYVLLMELALLGKIVQPAGPILYRRLHDKSAAFSMRKVSEVRKWVDPTFRSRLILPHWKLAIEYMRVASSTPIEVEQRARILFLLLRRMWWIRSTLASDIRGGLAMASGRSDNMPF